MRNPHGQTLLETIIALTIIVTGLGGAITLVTYSLRGSESSMNQLMAQQFAVEGIEVAQNIRDSNYLSGDAFDAGLTNGSDLTAVPAFDSASNTWSMDFGVDSIDDPGAILYLQGGVYSQSSGSVPGDATPFHRLLTLDNGAADEIAVTSTVSWTERGAVKQLSIERTLYNWR